MSWFKLLIFPKKNEIIRFKIILGFFVLTLVAGGFSFFYFKQPTRLVYSRLSPKPEVKEEEIPAKVKEFGIKIEKIEVLTPVIQDVDGTKKSIYNKMLKKGVAHYKGTSLPGKGSNIFIFGHSSTLLSKDPSIVFFVRLDELTEGDKIVVYYQGKEYRYSVFEKKIVAKNDLSVLKATKEEQLTLMTCWPIGSNAKRLIVKASL